MTASANEVTNLIREANGLRFDQPENARRRYERAIERARSEELRRELIKALKGLGQIARDANDRDEALSLYEQAVMLCRKEDDPLLLAHTIRHVADIHADNGRDDLAAPCYQEALAIYREHRETSVLDLANAVRPFALLKQKAGQLEDAKHLWAEARDLYSAANVPQGVAECSRHVNALENEEVTS